MLDPCKADNVQIMLPSSIHFGRRFVVVTLGRDEMGSVVGDRFGYETPKGCNLTLNCSMSSACKSAT